MSLFDLHLTGEVAAKPTEGENTDYPPTASGSPSLTREGEAVTPR